MAYDASRPVHSRNVEEPTFLGAVLQRTSWGAVIAGAVVAIGIQMLLTVLGIAIGASTADAADYNARVAANTATGPAIWWLVTGTLALLVGGCVVGRFAGMTRSPDVLLHGLTMWAVTALFGFMVVTSGAGMLYGTTLNASYAAGHRLDPNALRVNTSGVDMRVAAQDVDERGVTGERQPATADATPEEARRYARTASWWTLFGLCLGIAASVLGSWFMAPERIIVRPTSQG